MANRSLLLKIWIWSGISRRLPKNTPSISDVRQWEPYVQHSTALGCKNVWILWVSSTRIRHKWVCTPFFLACAKKNNLWIFQKDFFRNFSKSFFKGLLANFFKNISKSFFKDTLRIPPFFHIFFQKFLKNSSYTLPCISPDFFFFKVSFCNFFRDRCLQNLSRTYFPRKYFTGFPQHFSSNIFPGIH